MEANQPTLNLLDRPEIPVDVKGLLRVIPVQDQTEVSPSEAPEAPGPDATQTEPYCPPWATPTDATPVKTFIIDGQSFVAPAVHEEPNPLLYPMCTVGIIFASNGQHGSGVLVGPNLLLTAGHVAPWGAAPRPRTWLVRRTAMASHRQPVPRRSPQRAGEGRSGPDPARLCGRRSARGPRALRLAELACLSC